MKASGRLVLVLVLLGALGCSQSDPVEVPLDDLATGLDVAGSDTATGQSDTEVLPGQDLEQQDTRIPGDGVTIPEDQQGQADAQLTDTSPSDPDVDPSDITCVHLKGTYIEVVGSGVTVNGTQAILLDPKTYSIDGTLNDGQILVNVGEGNDAVVILDGVTITNTKSAPFYVLTADHIDLVAKEGTLNTLTDGAAYVFPDASTDEPNAALFSKGDIAILGAGTLTVQANYLDGIASKDDLKLNVATLSVTAKDDGIRGKDSLVVLGGSITVKSGGDALKSDNEEDATRGYIEIQQGTFDLQSGGDGMDAFTNVLISGGSFFVRTGTGAGGTVASTASLKAIKGVAKVQIDGGEFTLDCADDAIHSNGAVIINDGVFDIATGDDAIHGDATVDINGGVITITESYEGIESAIITVTAGEISLVSSDDGINVAGGNDGSGGWPGQPPGGSTGNYWFYLKGGTVLVDALGDGIDINGSVQMSGGTLNVNGPTGNMNGALDYDGTFVLTAGYLVAAGSSGMAMAPSSSGTTQNAVLVNFSTSQAAGTLVHLQDSSGTELLTFKPTKKFQSIAFSSTQLTKGQTYKVYLSGSHSGNLVDHIYEGGAYTPGNLYTTFTISSTITKLGSSGGPPGG